MTGVDLTRIDGVEGPEAFALARITGGRVMKRPNPAPTGSRRLLLSALQPAKKAHLHRHLATLARHIYSMLLNTYADAGRISSGLLRKRRAAQLGAQFQLPRNSSKKRSSPERVLGIPPQGSAEFVCAMEDSGSLRHGDNEVQPTPVLGRVVELQPLWKCNPPGLRRRCW